MIDHFESKFYLMTKIIHWDAINPASTYKFYNINIKIIIWLLIICKNLNIILVNKI